MRLTGIGASEIPMVLGESPHGGPIDLYLRKVGLDKPFKSSPAQDLGNFLEDGLAQYYCHLTGRTVELATTLRHPDHPWALATPDRWTLARTKILQIKIVGQWMDHNWSDHEAGYPAYVEAQVQWEMFVANVQSADVLALFGGTEPRLYQLRRDDDLIQLIFDQAFRFWHEHVIPRIPPPIDGSNASRYLMQKTFPVHNKNMLVATPEADQLAAVMFEAGADAKSARYQYDLCANKFLEMIGDSMGIRGTNWYATNKADKNGKRKLLLRATGKNKRRNLSP